MSQVISFKCPSCGGYLVFDPAKQRFQCPYCGGSFAENELKEQSEQRQQTAEQAAVRSPIRSCVPITAKCAARKS